MKRIVCTYMLALFVTWQLSAQTISFPFSQFTFDVSHNSYSHWKYPSKLTLNHSFIKKPEEKDWTKWYRDLLDYRKNTIQLLGKEEPQICYTLEKGNKGVLQIDAFGYDLYLHPGERMALVLTITTQEPLLIKTRFETKNIGKSSSAVIRKVFYTPDSLLISKSGLQVVTVTAITPDYKTDSLVITPVWELYHIKAKSKQHITIQNAQLLIEATEWRRKLSSKIYRYLADQSANANYDVAKQNQWSSKNFVMGFVFMWDQEFYNHITRRYMTDQYCDKMDKEFGGIQSVVLWHSYPNIGIDQKNQYDFYYQMPGGIDSLRKVIATFHKRGIKVFLVYNPWDFDTRRTGKSDAEAMADLLVDMDADGYYLDTWKSSLGVNSLFLNEKTLREAAIAKGKNVVFATEIHPQFKDIIGKDALLCSWGQEIDPFNNTGLSHVKWLKTNHIQHFINRGNQNRFRELSLAWINGQGIQIWENVFGKMNLWSAKDKGTLQLMNNIWKSVGEAYLTENLKPFYPTGNKDVELSLFELNGLVIGNLRNLNTVMGHTISVKLDAASNAKVYDIWNGNELKSTIKKGKIIFDITVKDLGAFLVTTQYNNTLDSLLRSQRALHQLIQSQAIVMQQELSTKFPKAAPTTTGIKNHSLQLNTQRIPSGSYVLKAKAKWREGGDFPEPNAKNNHEEEIERTNGQTYWIHNHTLTTNGFVISKRVITNGQFELFIRNSGYKPAVKENFLKHWNGAVCPPEIKDDPVVYIGLEDARSFATWAGGRLPTQWEWQLAAEKYPDQFIINEVFEWNESERNDGFNRSVSLKGGCSTWTMQESWWYLPTASYGSVIGGPQSIDNHVKYFIMDPCIDRASTLGFRIVFENK